NQSGSSLDCTGSGLESNANSSSLGGRPSGRTHHGVDKLGFLTPARPLSQERFASPHVSGVDSPRGAMVLTTFDGVGVGLGFGIGCGFGIGWGFGGMPLHTFGIGIGGGCGVGLGLGWGFGSAFGCKYRSSKVAFQGIEFDNKGPRDKSLPDSSKHAQ
ncbi:hypothetical protein GW17_00008117, partial [Ensete ventricosum]